MARTPTTTPTTPAADAASAEAAAKLAALIKFNSDALKALKDLFGARWAKIQGRCERLGWDDDQAASLAGKMMSTRTAWFPGDAIKALTAAAEGFLTALDLRMEAPAPVPAPVESPAAPAPAPAPAPATPAPAAS